MIQDHFRSFARRDDAPEPALCDARATDASGARQCVLPSSARALANGCDGDQPLRPVTTTEVHSRTPVGFEGAEVEEEQMKPRQCQNRRVNGSSLSSSRHMA